MARKKSKKGKGSAAKQTSQRHPKNARPASGHRASHSSHHAHRNFTLAEEARYTSSHYSHALNSTVKLRHRPVHFVSAGLLEGSIKEECDQPVQPDTEPHQATSAMAQMSIRSATPTLSDDSNSSEDEIVFHGRANPTLDAPPAQIHRGPTPKSQATPSSAQKHTSEQPDTDLSDSSSESVVQDVFMARLGGQSKWMTRTTPWESRSTPGIGWLPVRNHPERAAYLARVHDAAAIDDYMQNIRDFETKDTAATDESSASSSDDVDDVNYGDGNGNSNNDDDWLDRAGEDSDEIDDEEDNLQELDPNYDSSDDDDVESDEELDDERIAQILQKQEELGLGSDDIVLFGDDEFFDVPFHSQPHKFTECHDRPWTKRKSKSSKLQADFPSASVMADILEQDPYNGFDIMDLERPSLRPKKKGRRGQMPPEISDSDLNEQMQTAWEKDRAKKRLKKAEREELRKQGLLGRKGKAARLGAKFMDMNEVTEEIREFMFSDMQTLSLPPMEAKRRAVVHQFVHQLGLSSRSRGDGATRFTVLSKTLRTKRLDDEEFDEIVGQRRFKSRLQSALPKSARRTVKLNTVISYKDGEKVGASAPELGPENKGRRLLEKMGWTQGTALGALENKGILLPISHTVKTTKAGLQ